MIPSEHRIIIDNSIKKVREAKALLEESNDLLGPVFSDIIDIGDKELLSEYIDAFPSSFLRAQLIDRLDELESMGDEL